MIRALIVEDETTIRSGLVRHLSWAWMRSGLQRVRRKLFPFWKIIGRIWF